MLYTFNFRVKDSSSDRGDAEVTIVATSLIECRMIIRQLLNKKNRQDLSGHFVLIKKTSYQTGLLHDTIEARDANSSEGQDVGSAFGVCHPDDTHTESQDQD